jgi:hypothetical protein
MVKNINSGEAMSKSDIELSKHAQEMLIERNIDKEWVWRTIDTPHKKRKGKDGNIHYTKSIKERDGHFLHVVVDPAVYPNRIVTVFFDRRLGRKMVRK